MPLALALTPVVGLPIRWLLSRGGSGAERLAELMNQLRSRALAEAARR